MSQSYFSLGCLSQNSLLKLSTFRGYKSIYSKVYEECESQFSIKRAFWWLNLTIGMSHKFELWANCLARLKVLSCNTPAVMILLLLCMLHTCAILVTCQSRDSFELHTSWVFFILSHILPLHKLHLNTGYLIAKLQSNLVQNKANTWLNKFNLTHSIIKWCV